MYKYNTFYSRQEVECLKCFRKPCFSLCFFVRFFFNRRTSLEARLSVYILTFYLQLLQLVETGYPIRSFSFHLQSENCTTVERSGVR